MESSGLDGEFRRMPCASRRKPMMIRGDFRGKHIHKERQAGIVEEAGIVGFYC